MSARANIVQLTCFIAGQPSPVAFGKVFHPIVAVDLYSGDEAFEDLVAFEAGEYRPRGRTQGRGDEGGGQNDEKDEDKVVFENEARVASAFDSAEKTGALIAGADHAHRDHVDQGVCLTNGSRAEVAVEGYEGALQELQAPTRDKSQD